jgi:hypothetical protein
MVLSYLCNNHFFYTDPTWLHGQRLDIVLSYLCNNNFLLHGSHITPRTDVEGLYSIRYLKIFTTQTEVTNGFRLFLSENLSLLLPHWWHYVLHFFPSQFLPTLESRFHRLFPIYIYMICGYTQNCPWFCHVTSVVTVHLFLVLLMYVRSDVLNSFALQKRKFKYY